jgi:hypothetical protein
MRDLKPTATAASSASSSSSSSSSSTVSQVEIFYDDDHQVRLSAATRLSIITCLSLSLCLCAFACYQTLTAFLTLPPSKTAETVWCAHFTHCTLRRAHTTYVLKPSIPFHSRFVYRLAKRTWSSSTRAQRGWRRRRRN